MRAGRVPSAHSPADGPWHRLHFHRLNGMKSDAVDIGVPIFLQHADFISFEYVTSNEIAGSQDGSICSLMSNLRLSMTALHIYIPARERSQDIFLMIATGTGVRGHLHHGPNFHFSGS